MSNKIKELLSKVQETAKNGDLAEILNELKAIKKLLLISIMGDALEDVKNTLGGKKEELENTSEGIQKVSLKEALDHLEEITTVQKEKDERFFLLYHNSNSFEFAEAKDGGEFELKEDTVWKCADHGGEMEQNGNHPLVWCWIPENKIQEIKNAYPNTGTWNEMGDNPHAERFEIIVKPGTYKIYSELRE